MQASTAARARCGLQRRLGVSHAVHPEMDPRGASEPCGHGVLILDLLEICQGRFQAASGMGDLSTGQEVRRRQPVMLGEPRQRGLAFIETAGARIGIEAGAI